MKQTSKFPQLLISFSISAVIGLLFGFVSPLLVTWYTQPASQSEIIKQTSSTQTENTTAIELYNANQQKADEINFLESELGRLKSEENLNKARAQTVIELIQDYREERNVLFNDLQRQKAQLTDRIDTLESLIQERISDRTAQFAQIDEANAYLEIQALVLYPHILNDNPSIQQMYLAQPTESLEYAGIRFELMMQPENYAINDRIYKHLDRIHQVLSVEYGVSVNNTVVFCTDSSCEIQAELMFSPAYFDAWKLYVDLMRAEGLFNQIDYQQQTDLYPGIAGSILFSPMMVNP